MPWSKHSQLSQSIDSSRRQMIRSNDSMEKTSWDPRTTERHPQRAQSVANDKQDMIRSNDSLEKTSLDPRTEKMHSQTSQSLDSGGRQTVRKNDSLEKASWDPRTTELFIRICVEELQAGNRPGSHFSRLGWENILRKFTTITNCKYTRMQLKNRWDNMRREWGHWKGLLRGETGLGWNHEKGTIDATPEWWQQKIQALPEAAKFRERGPLLLNEQQILFSDVLATGESQWAPNSGLLPPHLQDDDSHDIDPTTETSKIPQNVTKAGPIGGSKRMNGEFSSRIRHKKSKKISTAEKIAKCLERMVDTIESESASSRASIGTARQFTIQECLEVLDNIFEIEEGDDLWMYATRLFLKPSIREMFLTIKKNETRLKWLQQQMEIDMQRRTPLGTSFHAHREFHHNDNSSFG